MSIDRDLWTVAISEGSLPVWPCPWCNGVGTLEMAKGTLHWSETARSLRIEDPDHHTTCTEGRFVCLATCGRCQEVVAICGRTVLNHDGGGPEYTLDHYPTSVEPAPPIFSIPRRCPKDIREEIEVAFKLYWSDPSSSMNRLRTGVELLLTEMKIARFAATKKGKRRRLSLHDRIVKLQSIRPELAEAIFAVKWLGNAGSHPGQVSRDDVLDGMELMEHILHERYEPRQKAVSRLSKAINRRKGPRT